jgi:hypothetical protein
MSRWGLDFPHVTPKQGAAKPITLVYPYYDNPAFLRRQIAHWSAFPVELRQYLSAVLVDDGSPLTPAADVLRDIVQPFPIRLFRIRVDVRWNWLAARNIGAHHAPDGWVLLTDMDHQIPLETAEAVVHGEHDPRVIYTFSRQEHTGESIHPHPNSWLMTKAMFWTVGGYDESLSGFYGTDGEYRRRCASVASVQVLTTPLVRYEFVEDSSTTKYQRKAPIDAAAQALIAARSQSWTPRVLSFPYDEVTA